MIMVLSVVAAETVPVALHAQSLWPVRDSAVTTSPTTGLNLSTTSFSGAGTTNSFETTNGGGYNNSGGYNTNFLKGIGSYKLDLANGLSLKTAAISATNPLTPNSLRRGNILPHEELLYGQHFTFGASYNGLNNTLRGGSGGMNNRNPGLSLHAGFSF
jgi:hypothetical protein